MRKILNILMTISLLICISACKKKVKNLRSFEFGDPILMNSSEVSDVRVKNVPTKPIEIGYFADANIYLEIVFIDGEKEYLHITEDFFPQDSLTDFITPGDKYYDILFKDKHIPLKFSLKENINPISYRVRFYNEKKELIETKYVSYMSSVSCTNTSRINNFESEGYFYKFEGNFNKNLNYVYKNMEVEPAYTKYLLRNSYDNYKVLSSYDVASHFNDGEYDHLLLYIGRYKDFVLNSVGIGERLKFKNETITLDKRSNCKGPVAFYENISNNIKNNVLPNTYIHESNGIYYSYYSMYNTSKLDFNLSLTNNLTLTDGSLLEIPSCLMESISSRGYSDFSGFNRNDGKKTSTKSIVDGNPDLYFAKYLNDGENIDINLASDDLLGYYKVDYVADCDIYLDLTYKFEEGSGWFFITLADAKLGIDYDESTLRFDYRYSDNSDFKTYSKPFIINDEQLGKTIVYYHS